MAYHAICDFETDSNCFLDVKEGEIVYCLKTTACGDIPLIKAFKVQRRPIWKVLFGLCPMKILKKGNLKDRVLIVERAKSGRSLCMFCQKRISQSSLRLKIRIYRPLPSSSFYHLLCVTRLMQSSLPVISYLDEVRGLENFNERSIVALVKELMTTQGSIERPLDLW